MQNCIDIRSYKVISLQQIDRGSNPPAYHLNIIYSRDGSQVDVDVYGGGAICREKNRMTVHNTKYISDSDIQVCIQDWLVMIKN